MKSYGTCRLERRQVGRGKEVGCWVIKAEAHVIIRLKRLFDRIAKASHEEVVMVDTNEVCRELVWFVDRYPLEVTPREHLFAGADRHLEHEAMVAQVLRGDYKPPEFELAHPARDYQRVAADLWLRSKSLLLADDLGVGKTVSALAGLTDKRTLPAVVVTLTSLPEQWRRMANRFAPNLKVYVCKTGKPIDLHAKHQGRFPDLVVLNYHKLTGWADYLGEHVRSIIFDECQELRCGGDTDKYKSAHFLASKAEFKLGLSATPIYNYGGEMFHVLDCLRPFALGTKEEFHRSGATGRTTRRSSKSPSPSGRTSAKPG